MGVVNQIEATRLVVASRRRDTLNMAAKGMGVVIFVMRRKKAAR